MWGLLFKYFATKDAKEAAEARAIFLSQFNHPSAEAVDDEALCSAVQGAVKDQLQFPNTAIFDRIYIRKCSDEIIIIRGAGMVSFAGLNGAASSGGYMVEFIVDGKCELLELHVDFDPVTLKELPQPQAWDGKSIPYARPPIAGPIALGKPDWAFRLKLCAIGLIIAVVVYVLRH